MRTTAHRPDGRDALLADLRGQLEYQPDSGGESLEALADALQDSERVPALRAASRAHPRQPLCHLYPHAAAHEAAEPDVADGPLVELLASAPNRVRRIEIVALDIVGDFLRRRSAR